MKIYLACKKKGYIAISIGMYESINMQMIHVNEQMLVPYVTLSGRSQHNYMIFADDRILSYSVACSRGLKIDIQYTIRALNSVFSYFQFKNNLRKSNPYSSRLKTFVIFRKSQFLHVKSIQLFFTQNIMSLYNIFASVCKANHRQI